MSHLFQVRARSLHIKYLHIKYLHIRYLHVRVVNTRCTPYLTSNSRFFAIQWSVCTQFWLCDMAAYS